MLGISSVQGQFLGCGDAFGSGGRFNTCFHVTFSSGQFLIDCGASSMIAMRRFGVDPNGIGTVFLSHLHGDHFGGLPFFLLDAQFYSKRNVPLTIAGPPGTEDRLRDAMEIFFPGSSSVDRKFETEYVEMTAGHRLEVGEVGVLPFDVAHDCGAPRYALRFEVEGRVIAYTGDSEWTGSLVAAGREADLLIAEALYFDRQIRGHLDYESLRSNLDRIAPKRLILTHLGPDMLARTAEVDCEIAEDGMIVELEAV